MADSTPALRRRLIVNADDFGQSPGVNAAVFQCHEHGILTSASLMVRWAHAREAAAYARSHPKLSVGLHIDLGEWTLVDGEWRERYVVLADEQPETVRSEILCQLETFRDLVGVDPTHLDSHQHVHCSSPADGVVDELGSRLRIPVRRRNTQVRYVGDFYGQGPKGEPLPDVIGLEGLSKLLRALAGGITEIGCHPGMTDDAGGMYIAEREQEARTLCDPVIRKVIEEERIELISFRDIALTV